MLDQSSPLWQHSLQSVALILLSLISLPVDTVILISVIAWARVARSRPRRRPASQPKTVLVTGVGMTKGLVLARLFAEAGHAVVGADFSALACGRVSHSLKSFHTLRLPETHDRAVAYAEALLSIIKQESVHLWVSCSGVSSAIEDGFAKEVVEKSTRCKAVQFDVESTKTFHEKGSFIEHVASLGLTIPESHTVTSKGQVEDVLLKPRQSGRRYICKSVGVDDSSRGDMTLLPFASREETSAHLSQLNISDSNPWIVQQFINGQEYCTHALVIRGHVRCFVACPSSELLMHYTALPAQSPLSESMLKFTQEVAASRGETFTGHLSFDFLVEYGKDIQSSEVVLYPIECNPRAHTAVALFRDTIESVDAYLELLDNADASSARIHQPLGPKSAQRYHWIGHDLVSCIIIPTLAMFRGEKSAKEWLDDIAEFFKFLVFWKDGTFELNDPLPWWWLYHVYWPTRLLICLFRGQKWSRVNVSTTKLFMCS